MRHSSTRRSGALQWWRATAPGPRQTMLAYSRLQPWALRAARASSCWTRRAAPGSGTCVRRNPRLPWTSQQRPSPRLQTRRGGPSWSHPPWPCIGGTCGHSGLSRCLLLSWPRAAPQTRHFLVLGPAAASWPAGPRSRLSALASSPAAVPLSQSVPGKRAWCPWRPAAPPAADHCSSASPSPQPAAAGTLSSVPWVSAQQRRCRWSAAGQGRRKPHRHWLRRFSRGAMQAEGRPGMAIGACVLEVVEAAPHTELSCHRIMVFSMGTVGMLKGGACAAGSTPSQTGPCLTWSRFRL
mmetsp:Transcript_115974/g.362824  ORF Transcript_115974/g.362824 Transcript_115974/m.362824 type:complete len:295 (+) Transcript_115974:1670-2554(+)